MVVFEQSDCIRVKVVVFGQKLLYLGKLVAFIQVGCIGARWLYSGKSGCIWGKKLLYSTKGILFVQIGCIQAKWLYFGKNELIRAKVVVFGKMVPFG